jgi:formate/nitrite transporter FocA (FNT family)
MSLAPLLLAAWFRDARLVAGCMRTTCPVSVQTNPGLQKLVMGAVGLPFGLIMVMICGAELFTGNTMIMGCAFYEGRITLPQLLRSWVVSFLCEQLRSDIMLDFPNCWCDCV